MALANISKLLKQGDTKIKKLRVTPQNETLFFAAEYQKLKHKPLKVWFLQTSKTVSILKEFSDQNLKEKKKTKENGKTELPGSKVTS